MIIIRMILVLAMILEILEIPEILTRKTTLKEIQKIMNDKIKNMIDTAAADGVLTIEELKLIKI